MASSFSLSSTDAIPNNYLPLQYQSQPWIGAGRGLNSYESCSNAPYNHEKDDLDLSQVSHIVEDPDIHLSTQLPSAFHRFQPTRIPELCAPDPDLGLTPEKRIPIQRSNLKHDAESKYKTGLKVRFDVESSSESELEKSPDKFVLQTAGHSDLSNRVLVEKHLPENSVNGLNGSQTLSKTYPYSVQNQPEKGLKHTEISNIETTLSQHNRKHSNSRKKTSQIDESFPADGDDLVVTREQEERPQITYYNFPFSNDTGSTQDTELLLSSALEKPEYNSSLRLGNEIKQLSQSKPDVAKVVQETLEKSETLRTGINEKAASRVNRNDNLFQGLASLEVPLDNIISQIENNQIAKVKSTASKNKSESKTKPSIKEPDLMEFFTNDLQPEEIDLSIHGVSFPKDRLCTANQETAFDLFRHNLAWEQTDH